jgi:trans-aconitate methyltransferase
MLYGTDISRAAVRDARRNAPGAEIAMESLASLVSYPAKSIDVVLCDAVLMYVPPHKIADAISEMCRLACRGVVISAWTGKPDYNEGAWVHDFEAMGATVTPFPEGSWSDERWNKYGAIVTLS